MRPTCKTLVPQLFFIISILLYSSCTKENKSLPVITTSVVSDITQTSATSGGEVTDDGGAAVESKGVCWSTSQDPTISSSKSSDGSGIGIYISFLTGLTSGTTYYVRAFATNSVGTGYGSQVNFSTIPVLTPMVSTTVASSISSEGATSGGNITADGGAPITERGVCWSTTPNPTISDNMTLDGSGPGLFISTLTGLSSGTSYYLRAYAKNSAGISYGNEILFTTNSITPGCNGLWMTTGIYPETSNLIDSVQQEFGSNYTIGDWSDIRAILNIDAWIECMNLQEDQHIWVTMYGNAYYSGNRHYFIRYSSDGVPGSFLVHDQVADKVFLGSWYGFNFNILAKKKL